MAVRLHVFHTAAVVAVPNHWVLIWTQH